MSDDIFDDEEWIDLEKTVLSGPVKADVTVRLTVTKGRFPAKTPKVRATVWLRREAAAWIDQYGPRFRMQVAGDALNLVRIIPDAARGQFEAAELKGVKRLTIGHVPLWPNELRDETEATWKITPGGLVLMLPADFAKSGAGKVPQAPAAPPEPAKPVRSPARAVALAPRAIAKVSREEVIEEMERSSACDFPREIGGLKLTQTEAEILDVLLKRDRVSKSGILAATHDPRAGDDERDEKTVDVLVSKLRSKLRALNIKIETIWGDGFRIDGPTKLRLRSLVEKARAA